MENTKIEWASHTANLWWGCMKVHAGCKNCYAESLDNRYNHENPHWGPGTTRKIVIGVWKDLNRFQREAAKAGIISRVFVGSMMDIFEDPIPVTDNNNVLIPRDTRIDAASDPMTTQHLRKIFFHNIDMGMYPNLIFLLLTKRPENINKYIPEAWKENPPVNVMFGTSIVNQETAKSVLDLMEVNGKRFLSCEPMVGPINLYPVLNLTIEERSGEAGSAIDWIICGGESGPKARPMHPDWARSLRDQCKKANIPYFFKQWGEWHESDLQERTDLGPKKRFLWPDGKLMYNVGKHEAGSLLDGQEHKEFITYLPLLK